MKHHADDLIRHPPERTRLWVSDLDQLTQQDADQNADNADIR